MRHPRISPAAVRAPAILEAEFQSQVIELATRFGWTYYHTHDSRRSRRGWPDLVLCRPPEILFVELKKSDGLVSVEQQEWIDNLTACGLQAFVARPADMPKLARLLARRPRSDSPERRTRS